MKTKIIVLGAMVVALAIGLWSFSKATNNEITMCVKHSGLVYVIGEGFKRTDCKNNDELLTWNIQGIPGPVGPQGEMGPQGIQGIQGIQGEQGLAGTISGTTIISNSITSLQNIATGTKIVSDVNCPSGSILLGGGAQAIYSLPQTYQDVQVAISESYPSGTLTWRGVGTVIRGPTASGTMTVTSHAICSQ